MAAHIPFAEEQMPLAGHVGPGQRVLSVVSVWRFPGPMAAGISFSRSHPGRLEPYLAYLAENGYRTVTSDAIARYVRDGVHPGPKLGGPVL